MRAVGNEDVAVTSGSGQKVVVIDGVPETTQVLRAMLEPRGHRVERVRGFDPELATRCNAVLVLHDDGASEATRRRKYGTTPRVVIGSLTSDQVPCPPEQEERRLIQPFHYAELIRAVESLLDADCDRRAA